MRASHFRTLSDVINYSFYFAFAGRIGLLLFYAFYYDCINFPAFGAIIYGRAFSWTTYIHLSFFFCIYTTMRSSDTHIFLLDIFNYDNSKW